MEVTMAEKLEKREDRRDRTLRYATRAWKVWAARMGEPELEGWTIVDGKKVAVPNPPLKWCVGRYRKGKAIGCDCRGRKHGQPKRSTGCCYGGDVRPSVAERQNNRRLCRRWAADLRGQDPDDIEI